MDRFLRERKEEGFSEEERREEKILTLAHSRLTCRAEYALEYRTSVFRSDQVNPMGMSDRLESKPFRTRELTSEICYGPIIFNSNPTQPVNIDLINT